MKKFLVLLSLVLLLSGCNDDSNEVDIKKIMKENDYVIIDVRTKEEYDEKHVIDAINIPYDEIENASLDKNKIIFVYCAGGARSKMAFETLTNLGYNVYDLGAFANVDLPKE